MALINLMQDPDYVTLQTTLQSPIGPSSSPQERSRALKKLVDFILTKYQPNFSGSGAYGHVTPDEFRAMFTLGNNDADSYLYLSILIFALNYTYSQIVSINPNVSLTFLNSVFGEESSLGQIKFKATSDYLGIGARMNSVLIVAAIAVLLLMRR